MVLNKSGSGDDIIEVVVMSTVVGIHAELLCGGKIFASRQHVEFLRHPLHTDIGLIRNLKSLARAFLRLHFDDARRTARTVECCLGSILQYGETLDVGRIDG